MATAARSSRPPSAGCRVAPPTTSHTPWPPALRLLVASQKSKNVSRVGFGELVGLVGRAVTSGPSHFTYLDQYLSAEDAPLCQRRSALHHCQIFLFTAIAAPYRLPGSQVQASSSSRSQLALAAATNTGIPIDLIQRSLSSLHCVVSRVRALAARSRLTGTKSCASTPLASAGTNVPCTMPWAKQTTPFR